MTDPIKTIKAAFFDIDGVLSVPRYFKDGKFVSGGSPEWWEEFSKDEDAYKDCIAPPIVKAFIQKLLDNGVMVKYLSTESIIPARRAKEKFIEREYKGLTGAFVMSDSDKISFLNGYYLTNEDKITPEEIYLLDDTFSIVTDASDMGFNAHHISEFLINPIGLWKE